MSNINQSKVIKNGLDHTFEEKCSDIRESNVRTGLSNLKSRIKDMNIQVESATPKVEVKAVPRYENTELADVARKIYRDNVNPLEKKEKKEPVTVPDTQASRAHMRAMANALAGMRRNGGDDGRLAPTAGPNGGSTGTRNCNNYFALTTSMTLEEYEDYINKKFMGESEEEVEEEEIETELLTEKDTSITELEEAILKLEDISWQSIDKVMRRIADDYDITPKELHKNFKAEHGMIPDDWAKEQQVAEQVGWFPLDEAIRLHDKIGNVYEVSFIFRGGTQRLKFFWPEVGTPSRKDMEQAVKKFWPGARLLAYYVSMHPGDDITNQMVVIPAMSENFEVVPNDLWDFMSEEDTEVYDEIAAEEGEPVSPVFIREEGGYEMLIADHDTGEEKWVMFGEGSLHDWFNKSKSKDGKPGWVQSDGSPCANEKGETKTPKCYSSAKKASMSKSELRSADARKSRQDPNQQSKSGAAKPTYVSTDKPDTKKEEFEPVDEACWKGYKKKGMKTMFGKRYPNCVKEDEEFVAEDDMKGMSVSSGHKRSTESGAGLTAKGVAAYRRKNPGSKLKTAVTTPPSKLKPGSKAAKRRKSFCARSRGWTGERGKAARRRWNC